MENEFKKLTMDQPTNYQIKVPGAFGKQWSDWGERMEVVLEKSDEGSSITTLTGIFDQSALMGLLRQLYSLGLPIISVTCIQFSGED